MVSEACYEARLWNWRHVGTVTMATPGRRVRGRILNI